MSNPVENLVGNRFGRLLAVSRADNRGHRTMWNTVCDCGHLRITSAADLKRGRVTSCGCFQVESFKARATTHGMKDSREYQAWGSIKQRCFNENCEAYPDYGGRGISVCQQWSDSFEQFYEDMGPRPDGMTIDRIDNNGNYEPGNCRWTTMSINCSNKRNNKTIEAFGIERVQAFWARMIGVRPSSIARALSRGRSIEWLAARRGVFDQILDQVAVIG